MVKLAASVWNARTGPVGSSCIRLAEDITALSVAFFFPSPASSPPSVLSCAEAVAEAAPASSSFFSCAVAGALLLSNLMPFLVVGKIMNKKVDMTAIPSGRFLSSCWVSRLAFGKKQFYSPTSLPAMVRNTTRDRNA